MEGSWFGGVDEEGATRDGANGRRGKGRYGEWVEGDGEGWVAAVRGPLGCGS